MDERKAYLRKTAIADAKFRISCGLGLLALLGVLIFFVVAVVTGLLALFGLDDGWAAGVAIKSAAMFGISSLVAILCFTNGSFDGNPGH